MNINVNFKKDSFNLGLIEVNEATCSSETLISMIKKKLNEFDLKMGSNTLIATADGASINLKLERI